MKSVRLDADLKAKLSRAALATGKSESEFIREAVARRCDEVLGETLAESLKPYIGVIKGSGGRASRTGKAFVEILLKKKSRGRL